MVGRGNSITILGISLLSVILFSGIAFSQEASALTPAGTLTGTIRDFSTDYPHMMQGVATGVVTGMVESDLGLDGNPVLVNTAIGTGGGVGESPAEAANAGSLFDEWYNDTTNNRSCDLSLSPTFDGVDFTYNSGLVFFPIDDTSLEVLFVCPSTGLPLVGNEGNSHNYHFTYEIHGTFTYQTGQTFEATTDDDYWLFINDKLAIDLGGLHPAASSVVSLDALRGPLGLVDGQVYNIDMFFAERQTTGSDLRFITNIEIEQNEVNGVTYSPGGDAQFNIISQIDEPTTAGKPDADFPFGFVSFELATGIAGDADPPHQVVMTITTPTPISKDNSFWYKVDSRAGWLPFALTPDPASIVGDDATVFTITFTDGVFPLDADAADNGVIIDPAGIGVLTNTPPFVVIAAGALIVNEDDPSPFTSTSVFDDDEDGAAGLSYVIVNDNPSLVSTQIINVVEGEITLLQDANGSVDITITATDSGGLTAQDTLTLTVTAVNDVPFLIPLPAGTVPGFEDATDLIFDLNGLFGDVEDGEAGITYSVESSDTSIATASIDVNNIITISFVPDAFGSVGITVTATDTGGLTASDTLTIEVAAVNDPPVPENNDYTTDEDNPVSGNVITDDTGSGLDSDVDNPVSSLSVVTVFTGTVDPGVVISPTGDTVIVLNHGGVLTISANGAFTYDPSGEFEDLAANQEDDDYFTYVLSDGTDDSEFAASVEIVVFGVNDDPVATDDNYTTDEDNNIPGSLLSGNVITDDTGNGVDSDIDDGDVLAVTEIIAVAGSNGGTFTIAEHGAFTFNPDSDFQDLGTDEPRDTSIVYTLSDYQFDIIEMNLIINPIFDSFLAYAEHVLLTPLGGSDTATLTVTVTGINDAPVLPTLDDIGPIEGNTAGGANIVFGPFTATDAEEGTVSVTCTIPDGEGTTDVSSGGFFAYNSADAAANGGDGTTNTTVTCSATDTDDPNSTDPQTTVDTFDASTQDLTPPNVDVLTIPDVGPIEGNTAGGANIVFGPFTAVDIVDGNFAVTCTDPSTVDVSSGGFFAYNSADSAPNGGDGTTNTTVTCAATDNSGNLDDDTFDASTKDTTDPALVQPIDITIEAKDLVTLADDKDPVDDTGDATAPDVVDPAPVIEFDDSSVNPAPDFGTKIIEVITRTWTATDASGNTVSLDQIITTIDTTVPAVTLPANILADVTTEFTLNEDGSVINTFTHTLTVTGVTASPPTYTIEATLPEGADATVHVEGDDVVGLLSLVCTVTSDDPTSVNDVDDFDDFDNTVLALADETRENVTVEDKSTYRITDKDSENHTLECVATDAGGNTDTKTGTITIKDETVPQIIAPPLVPGIDAVGVNTPRNINTATNVANEAESNGAVAADIVSSLGDGSLVVTDNRDAVASALANSPECNSTLTCFFAGTTTVTYSAIDVALKTADDTQDVIVTPTPLVMEYEDGDTTFSIINGQVYFEVDDYRGNLDNNILDSITVNVATTDADEIVRGSINVVLEEDTINSHIFSAALDNIIVTLNPTSGSTDESNGILEAAHLDTISASYVPSSAAPEGSGIPDSETITAEAIDPNERFRSGAAVPSADKRITFNSVDADVLVVEGSTAIYALTGSEFNDVRNTDPTTKQKPFGIFSVHSEDSAGNVIQTIVTAGGNPTMKGFETGVNSEIFVGKIMVTATSSLASSNPVVGVLHAPVGSKIVATYTALNADSSGDSVFTSFLTVIAPESGQELVTFSINPDIREPCAVDIDKDAICDEWEDPSLGGLTIPLEDDDGNIITEYHLPCGPGTTDPVCPSPDRKDVYLEIDFMSGHLPDAESISQVVEMFDISPVVNVPANPDPTKSGITLHAIVDDDIQTHRNVIPFTSSDPVNPGFQEFKTSWFGSQLERGCEITLDNSGAEIVVCPVLTASETQAVQDTLNAKRQAFHYALFAHSLEGQESSSGYAELLGNDLVITLGAFAGADSDNDSGVGSVSQQASTLAHELGHNLGLSHNGKITRDFNCAPNYLSVMNYAYQFEDLVSDRPLDYSRQWAPALKQFSLLDSKPIREFVYPDPVLGDRTLDAVFGFTDSTGQLSTVVVPTGGISHPDGVTPGSFVDWNQDGVFDTTGQLYNVQISNLGIPGCDSATSDVKVFGWNDWSNVVFDFKQSTTFASGAYTSTEALGEPDLTFFNELQASLLDELSTAIIESGLDSATKTTLLAQLDDIEPLVVSNQLEDFENGDPGAITLLETMRDSGILPTTPLTILNSIIEIYTASITPSEESDHTEAEIPIANAGGIGDGTTFTNFYEADEGELFSLDGSQSTDPDRCVPGIFCQLHDIISGNGGWDWKLDEPFGAPISDFTVSDEDIEQHLLPIEFGDGDGTSEGTQYFVRLQVTDDGLRQGGLLEYADGLVRTNNALTDTDDIAVVTINNVAPTIESDIVAPYDPALPTLVGQPIQVSSTFSDPGFLDSHTGADGTTWNWDALGFYSLIDETIADDSENPVRDVIEPIAPIVINEIDNHGSVTSTHTYTQPGLYNLRLTVVDDDGGSDSIQTGNDLFVVNYDPDAGKISGEGEVIVRAGAFTFDDEHTDHSHDQYANFVPEVEFDLKSEYKPGYDQPRGKMQLEIELEIGGEEVEAEFDADKIQQWQIVSDSATSGRVGIYQGTGTLEIEDESQGLDEFKVLNLGFFVYVIDGSFPHGSGGDDLIRILIWKLDSGYVIFDNQRDLIYESSPARTEPPKSPARHDADDDDDDGNIKVKLRSDNPGEHEGGSHIIESIIESMPPTSDVPLTAPEKIISLIDYINVSFDPEFLDDDLLEGKGMIKKLNKALKKSNENTDEGNSKACKELNSFTKQMQKLVDKNKIGSTIGGELISKANDIKPLVCTP